MCQNNKNLSNIRLDIENRISKIEKRIESVEKKPKGVLPWLTILISIVALISSSYFSYMSIRKKAKLSYYESWDLHEPARFSDLRKNLLTKSFQELIPWRAFLIYYVQIVNDGDKQADNIILKFSNLKKLELLETDKGFIPKGPYSIWEANSENTPLFIDGRIEYPSLSPNESLNLNIIIPLEQSKNYIDQDDIPYILYLKAGKLAGIRKTDLPFEEGTIRRLQSRLQKQFVSTFSVVGKGNSEIR